MRQPPRTKGERLLHWPLAIRAYFFLGLLEAAAKILKPGGRLAVITFHSLKTGS